MTVYAFYYLISAAFNLDALNIASPFKLIIIYDAGHIHSREITGRNLLDNGITGISCTDYHNIDGIVPVLMLMLPTPDKPIGEPAHKYHSDQNKSIHEVVAVRNRSFFHTHYEETYAVYSRRYHGRHYNIL